MENEGYLLRLYKKHTNKSTLKVAHRHRRLSLRPTEQISARLLYLGLCVTAWLRRSVRYAQLALPHRCGTYSVRDMLGRRDASFYRRPALLVAKLHVVVLRFKMEIGALFGWPKRSIVMLILMPLTAAGAVQHAGGCSCGVFLSLLLLLLTSPVWIVRVGDPTVELFRHGHAPRTPLLSYLPRLVGKNTDWLRSPSVVVPCDRPRLEN